MTTATDIPPRRPGPKLPELALTDDERATLGRWARRRKSSQALALRCRIVLACAEGHSNQAVADRLGISKPTVTKWRSRFVARRLEGLADEPRPGAARTITDEQIEQVLVTTLEATPNTTAALSAVGGVADDCDEHEPDAAGATTTSQAPARARPAAATPAGTAAGGSPARSAAPAARPVLRAQRPPVPTAAARARITARNAWASIDKVTCRYQAG
jgi:DNA-binding CsgD family transcriptional regulator